MGGSCALQKSGAAHVGSGSLAVVAACLRHVRFTPDSGHAADRLGCRLRATTGREQMQQPGMLFYHFVRAREQRRRKFDPERLGCLEIEHQPQLGGSLYRQIGRHCAL